MMVALRDTAAGPADMALAIMAASVVGGFTAPAAGVAGAGVAGFAGAAAGLPALWAATVEPIECKETQRKPADTKKTTARFNIEPPNRMSRAQRDKCSRTQHRCVRLSGFEERKIIPDDRHEALQQSDRPA